MMIAVAGAGAILGFRVGLLSYVTEIGDGSPVKVPLLFLIMDETTGRPIEGALVRLPDLHGSGTSLAATTSSEGLAKIFFDTFFSEGFNTILMHRVYRHVSYREDVEVSAKGFQLSRFLLEDRTEGPRFHYDPAPPPILVSLSRE
jgi:hypothetical protein